MSRQKTDVGSRHFGVLPFLSYYKPSYAFRQDARKISIILQTLNHRKTVKPQIAPYPTYIFSCQ